MNRPFEGLFYHKTLLILSSNRMKANLDTLLEHNIDRIYPNKEALKAKLSTEGKLVVYLGIDPSSTKIHLGNAIALWKLREFQDLGHKVILLIGDFTGMIGDPTDQNATRKPLSREEVLENSQSYQSQAAKILLQDRSLFEVRFNSHWLAKLTFEEVVKLSAHFTISQFLERDMFQKRLLEKHPIGLHEFLYPLMQGYDSVAMNVDVEIGGSDQTFNMLVGRQLVKDFNNKEKFVITLPLLEGTDGRKMSKSFGNSIDIDENATEMYGKIMSIEDKLILKYFEFCTYITLAELKRLRDRLTKENPIILKKELARAITSLYHTESEVKKAEAQFQNVIQNKGLPEVLEEVEFAFSTLPKNYAFFLLEAGLVNSVSEAARLASQGAILFDNVRIENVREDFSTEKSRIVVKVGKRKFKVLKFI